MGLPQLDFRVPEATWFKSVLAGKFGAMPSLSSTGVLAWPYKIAVVAVMTLVAGGTLVTFGSARAETPSSAQMAALPGSDEASPTVEGQVLPPSNALLNGADLLSTLNLTDYSPGDTTLRSLPDEDDDEDSDDEGDEGDEGDEDSEKQPTTAPTSNSDDDEDSEESAPVEGPQHKQWVKDKAAYESAHDAWESQKAAYEKCLADSLNINLGQCEGKKPGDEPDDPGSEPSFTS